MFIKNRATWDKLRKERDFHKMHHRRVQQEKTKLNFDIEKLRTLHRQYESKYQDLSNKYELKEKLEEAEEAKDKMRKELS